MGNCIQFELNGSIFVSAPLVHTHTHHQSKTIHIFNLFVVIFVEMWQNSSNFQCIFSLNLSSSIMEWSITSAGIEMASKLYSKCANSISNEHPKYPTEWFHKIKTNVHSWCHTVKSRSNAPALQFQSSQQCFSLNLSFLLLQPIDRTWKPMVFIFHLDFNLPS